MTNLWYTIPRKITIRRGDEEQDAMRIEQGFGNNNNTISTGIDGGFTLSEAEDLLWRLKQGIHLLKYGKLPRQRT